MSRLFVLTVMVLLLGACTDGLSSANNEGQEQNNNEPQNNNSAQQMLSSFFEMLNHLEEQYGPDLVTVQEAIDVYPILSQTRSSTSVGCPMDYYSSEKFKMQQAEKMMPCYTPIVTIHDRITNPIDQSHYLPEVLLLSGLDTPKDMDMLGPSSIYETLKLLLDCAACELMVRLMPFLPDLLAHGQTSRDSTTR